MQGPPNHSQSMPPSMLSLTVPRACDGMKSKSFTSVVPLHLTEADGCTLGKPRTSSAEGLCPPTHSACCCGSLPHSRCFYLVPDDRKLPPEFSDSKFLGKNIIQKVSQSLDSEGVALSNRCCLLSHFSPGFWSFKKTRDTIRKIRQVLLEGALQGQVWGACQ